MSKYLNSRPGFKAFKMGKREYLPMEPGQVDPSLVPVPPAPMQAVLQAFAKKKQPPKAPTALEMASNFTAAVAGLVKDGFKVVSKEDYERRKAICDACPEWDAKARAGLGKCMKCGCTKLKLWLASQACPINKWAPVESATAALPGSTPLDGA